MREEELLGLRAVRAASAHQLERSVICPELLGISCLGQAGPGHTRHSKGQGRWLKVESRLLLLLRTRVLYLTPSPSLSVTPAPGGSTHSLASMGSASMWYTYRQQTHMHAHTRTHTQFKNGF